LRVLARQARLAATIFLLRLKRRSTANRFSKVQSGGEERI